MPAENYEPLEQMLSDPERAMAYLETALESGDVGMLVRAHERVSKAREKKPLAKPGRPFKIIGNTMMLSDGMLVGAEQRPGRLIIRVWQTYKTPRQERFGGYTVERMIKKTEVSLD